MEQDYQFIFHINFKKNCHWNKKHQKKQNIEGVAMPDPLLSISCTGIVYIKVLFVCLFDKWEIHLGSTACAGAFVEHQHLLL